jgi:hypothetical protein
MTRTIEFKPDVTVRVEATEDEINVYINGDQLMVTVSPHESYLETRYPGLTAAIEELRKREPKIEVRWEQGMATVYVNGSRWGMFSHENQTHGKIDDRYPGAWEKHVLPCILANRPLKENEYRMNGAIVEMEWRPDNGGQVRIKRTTCGQDDWSVWHYDHSLVRPEIVAYLRKKNAEHTAAKPKKPSERIRDLAAAHARKQQGLSPGQGVMYDVTVEQVLQFLDEEFERRGKA